MIGLARGRELIVGTLPHADTLELLAVLRSLQLVPGPEGIAAQVLVTHMLIGLAVNLRACIPGGRPQLDSRMLAALALPMAAAPQRLLAVLIDTLEHAAGEAVPPSSPLPFAASRTDAKMHVVLAQVRDRYRDPRFTLKAAARHVNLSHWHLGRLLTRHTGHSFVHHLRAARLETARVLLVTSFLTIKEVAGEVGYNSVTHLDRDFRRRFGCPPSEWRSRHQRGDRHARR